MTISGWWPTSNPMTVQLPARPSHACMLPLDHTDHETSPPPTNPRRAGPATGWCWLGRSAGRWPLAHAWAGPLPLLARIRPTSDRCCRLARCAESTRYRIQSISQPQWVCGQQGRAKWLLVRPATHSCFSAVIFLRLRFLFVCLSPGVSHCPPPTSSHPARQLHTTSPFSVSRPSCPTRLGLLLKLWSDSAAAIPLSSASI